MIITLNKKQIAAFSLIELSIILTILAITVTSFVTMNQSTSTQRLRHTTLEKMDDIKNALEQYYLANSFFPCPARYSIVDTDEDFGRSKGTNLAAGCTSTDSDIYDGTDQTISGLLPFKDLGLSPELAIDSWGNRILYAIYEPITVEGHGICINSKLTVSSVTANITTTTPYVIISFGADGIGSISKFGSATYTVNSTRQAAINTDSAEQIDNHHRADDIIDKTFYKPEKTIAGFDDIVAYGTGLCIS